MDGTWKLTIYAEDKIYDIDRAIYECDGLMLVVNRGDEQFIFNMDYIKWFKADAEVDEDEDE